VKPPEDYPEGLQFVPMIWSKQNLKEQLIEIHNQISNKRCKYVLGFNEPDLESQTGMTVDEALSLWPQLEALAVPLGSPVASAPLNLWMRSFMQKADEAGRRIDFITVHLYDMYKPEVAHMSPNLNPN